MAQERSPVACMPRLATPCCCAVWGGSRQPGVVRKPTKQAVAAGWNLAVHQPPAWRGGRRWARAPPLLAASHPLFPSAILAYTAPSGLPALGGPKGSHLCCSGSPAERPCSSPSAAGQHGPEAHGGQGRGGQGKFRRLHQCFECLCCVLVPLLRPRSSCGELPPCWACMRLGAVQLPQKLARRPGAQWRLPLCIIPRCT